LELALRDDMEQVVKIASEASEKKSESFSAMILKAGHCTDVLHGMIVFKH
jgi:hypothetical protein